MRKDATRDARGARVMGRVDAMAISRLWVRGCDGRRRARRAVERDDGRVDRREATTTSCVARRRRRLAVSSSSSRASSSRENAATDRTTHSRAAPTRATKVVIFYHG